VNNSESQEIVAAFRQFCGVERFNKFKHTLVDLCRIKKRLMFWQEQLWKEFTQSAGLNIPATFSNVERILIQGRNIPKVFKRVSKNGDSETYTCEDIPDMRLELTHHFDHYVSGFGKQHSSTDWRVVRGGKIIYSGVDVIPIGDWISARKTWKE